MKTWVFPLLIALLFPLDAQSFDWHGVRSGMTEVQAQQAMRQIGGTSYTFMDTWLDFEKSTIIFPPREVLAKYDHAGKLFELRLLYITSDLTDSAVVALKAVLESKFDARIVEGREGISAVITDTTALENDIEYYKRKFGAEL